MLKKGNTLHFINRLDESNCGDRVVCPLPYYYDFFKQYRIIRHDMRFIDYDSIDGSDVVIIGGGGMFDYAEFTNRGINRVLDTGATVIAWSPGFNTHTEYCGTFKTKIKFDRFAAVTVRDFHNDYGLDYLPDVTCKLPGLKKQYMEKRMFGIARHKDYPIRGFSYDTITNDQSLEDILRFIGETEIVISNSFHMIYWSLLMGKRTICADPFSSKFYSYKYKPTYFNTQKDKLQSCVEQAQNYQILEESLEATDKFFEQVRQLIEARLEPMRDQWRGYELITKEAVHRELFRETQMQEGDLLAPQLFIDTGDGFTEKQKLIAINSVYGDELHTVRFDLSNFQNIQALRFDPIESRYCEVEICTAKTKGGAVTLTAWTAVRAGTWDKFLCTDPQYGILTPCSEFLEITFRLRLMTLFDSERTICNYVEFHRENERQLREQLEEKDIKYASQTAQLEQRDTWISDLTAHLKQQDIRLNSLTAELEERTVQLNSLTVELEQRDIRLNSLTMELEERDVRFNGLTAELEERNTQANDLTTALEERNAQLDEVMERLALENMRVAHQDEQIQALYHSKSWKLTAPLRAVVNFFRKFKKGDGENGAG